MPVRFFAPKPPRHAAVLWDGTNLDDVFEVLDGTRFDVADPVVDGVLTITGGASPVSVSPGMWVMPVHVGLAVTDEELQQGFMEVAP